MWLTLLQELFKLFKCNKKSISSTIKKLSVIKWDQDYQQLKESNTFQIFRQIKN